MEDQEGEDFCESFNKRLKTEKTTNETGEYKTEKTEKNPLGVSLQQLLEEVAKIFVPGNGIIFTPVNRITKEISMVNAGNFILSIKTINGQNLTGPGNLVVDKNFVGLNHVNNTSDLLKPVSLAASAMFSAKQDTLVSQTNIKTLNNYTLLDEGDLSIDKIFVGLDQVDNTADLYKPISIAQTEEFSKKQDKLLSSINFKTINGYNLLSGGDLNLDKYFIGLGQVDNTTDLNKPVSFETQLALQSKQNVLVSGQDVKTLNGETLLGFGNITLSRVSLALDNVDNTSDDNKPVSNPVAIELAKKQDVLLSGENLKTLNQQNLLDEGDLIVDKFFVGLDQVDNTSDANKPLSFAQTQALSAKLDKLTISGGENELVVKKSDGSVDASGYKVNDLGSGSLDLFTANKILSLVNNAKANLDVVLAYGDSVTLSGLNKVIIVLDWYQPNPEIILPTTLAVGEFLEIKNVSGIAIILNGNGNSILEVNSMYSNVTINSGQFLYLRVISGDTILKMND